MPNAMIVCSLAGSLPAIDRPPNTTQSAGSGTLTEVVTAAIYGVPLKAGSGPGSLRESLEPLQLEGLTLWRNENGPGWLRQHLELIANAKSWPFKPDTQDDNERIALNWFTAAQRWLTKIRRQGFAEGLHPELAGKVMQLAGMTDAEAIAHALAEADRIERAERAINAKSADFYKLLSDAIATQRITLKAIGTDPKTNVWLARTPGEPPHQSIPANYFELPLCHDLFDNNLEANRFSSEAEMLDSIFNRIERENVGMLVKYSNVKVPPEDATWLLSTFRGEANVRGDRPLSATSNAPPKAERGDVQVLKVAFAANYPNGVPSGTKPGEVYQVVADWIQRQRKRTAPSRKTFDRRRKEFWKDSSDSSDSL